MIVGMFAGVSETSVAFFACAVSLSANVFSTVGHGGLSTCKNSVFNDVNDPVFGTLSPKGGGLLKICSSQYGEIASDVISTSMACSGVDTNMPSMDPVILRFSISAFFDFTR